MDLPVEQPKIPEKKGDVIEIPIGKWLSRVRANPWIVSTVVLGIVLIVFLSFTVNNGISGNVVNAETAGERVTEFINQNPALNAEVTLLDVEREGELYKITLLFEGQEVPVYSTLDGQFLVSNLVPLSDSPIGEIQQLPHETGEVVVPTADDDAVLGDENAPITIIEFSDYQCPFCGRFWSDTLPELKEKYIDTGKVKLIYRDLPLESIHPMATPAAEAAECVRAQGGDTAYFAYHDTLFERQGQLNNENFVAWAEEQGYDIQECFDNREFSEEVQKDLSDGSLAGITGTPSFYINDVPLSGAQPFNVFEQIIEAELSNVQA